MAKKTPSKKAGKKTTTKVVASKKKVKPNKPVAKRKKKAEVVEIIPVQCCVGDKKDNLFVSFNRIVKDHPVEFISAFMIGLAFAVIVLF